MTMPVSGTININGTMSGAPVTVSANVQMNVPIAPTPAPAIFQPAPTSCFLCVRKPDNVMLYPALATTVYKGTYLCRECVRSLPDEFLINEFPPTL
jgi:hypothetical protein